MALLRQVLILLFAALLVPGAATAQTFPKLTGQWSIRQRFCHPKPKRGSVRS
jgi:hypothetical protein